MPEAETNGGWRPERPQVIIAAVVAAVVAVAIVVVVLASGGDDGDSNANGSDETFPPNVVTNEELEAQEEGSPGRALLEWWQSFQFGDATQVVSLTSTETLDEIGEGNLEELVATRGQGLQGIEVFGATEDGDTASVRVGLLQFVPEEKGEPPPDEPTASTPDTFAMQQEDGEWLFAATDYLEPQVESLKAAQKQQDEGEQQTTTTEETTTGE
jgi:hypothetical protein